MGLRLIIISWHKRVLQKKTFQKLKNFDLIEYVIQLILTKYFKHLRT